MPLSSSRKSYNKRQCFRIDDNKHIPRIEILPGISDHDI